MANRMTQMAVMKDASEIIDYNNPGIPLYIQRNCLSNYVNMEALCHYHEDIEYIRVVKGRMVFHVNGEKILIRENDGLLVNSRQMHYGSSDNRADSDFICVVFHPRLISSNSEITDKYIRPVAEHPRLSWFYLDSCKPECAGIIAVFDSIYETYQKKEPGFELMCISLLTSAWTKWYQCLQTELETYKTELDGDLPVQQTMISFIYEHYTSRLSLQDIAEAGNVSRSKCCRIFRKYLNKTPVEFLNAYRLEVSMRLLAETSASITEIALSCGFQSHSYYSEVFRQHKGVSPSDYRARLPLSPDNGA